MANSFGLQIKKRIEQSTKAFDLRYDCLMDGRPFVIDIILLPLKKPELFFEPSRLIIQFPDHFPLSALSAILADKKDEVESLIRNARRIQKPWFEREGKACFSIDHQDVQVLFERQDGLDRVEIVRSSPHEMFVRVPAHYQGEDLKRALQGAVQSFYRDPRKPLEKMCFQHILNRNGATEFCLNEHRIPIDIERRKNRKSYGATFRDGRVILAIPYGGSKEYALYWFDQKEAIVRRWLSNLVKQKEDRASQINRFEQDEIEIYGKIFRIRVAEKRAQEGIRNEEVHLYIRRGDDRAKALTRVLKAHFKSYAQAHIQSVLSRIGPTKRPFKELKISSAKTLWGTCNAQGVIRLNWRAVFLPEELIDYLICHEIAHLQEMSHSRAFWQWVGLYCPNYRALETALKQKSIRQSFLL